MKRWRRSGDAVEESGAARAAVLAASAAAVVAVMATTGMVFTPLLTLVCLAAGHLKSWRGRRSRRSRWGQAGLGLLLAFAVVYLVLDLTAALFGGALPQAKFALLAMAITSFDLKSRRNLYSHTWHSLAILYVAALFAWDWLFLLFVLAWAGTVGVFVVASRQQVGEAPHLTSPQAGGGGGATQPPAWRLARALAPWGLAWLGLGAITFVALPRFAGRPISVPLLISLPSSEEAKGEILAPVLPLVGSSSGSLAEQGINLRVRGALGDEVVMRVRAPAASYWREYVLEQYEGQAWRRLTHPARGLSPIAMGITIDDEVGTGIATLPQTFYIQRQLSIDVPLSYPVKELYFPARQLTLVDTGTVRAPYSLRPGVNYAAVSVVRDTSAAHLRAATSLPPGSNDIAIDTALPPSVPGRVKELADRLAAGKPTSYDKTVAIADYLRGHYRYSLDTPRLPAGADAVDRFLFVDHVGFCEQFASALTVMLREEGIPARLVVGYGTGDHDGLTGTFTVRAHDAHAWVEVLFANTGWVPFDASPGFSGEPVAQAPARWFLSDIAPNLALRSLGSLGSQLGGAAPVAALALVALAVAGLGLGRRRSQPVAELRAYAAAQRWLGRAGLPVRAPTTTPAEHLAQVARVDAISATRLEPLVAAVELRLFAGRRNTVRQSLWPLLRHLAARRVGMAR